MLRSAMNHGTALMLFTCLSLAGCGGGDEETGPADTTTSNGSLPSPSADQQDAVDPHDIPPTEAEIEQLRRETSTYAAAVERIQSYRDTIRDGASGPEPAEAHRPLDMLDYVLQWLPEAARSSDVPREHWMTIGENAQELRDLFNQVHARIDAGEAPDYAAVAEEIDAAIDELVAVEAFADDAEN